MASNRKPRIFKNQPILKTMFYMEGNPTATLVTNSGGIHQQSIVELSKAEAALSWCRDHACTLVYSPVDLLKN